MVRGGRAGEYGWHNKRSVRVGINSLIYFKIFNSLITTRRVLKTNNDNNNAILNRPIGREWNFTFMCMILQNIIYFKTI